MGDAAGGYVADSSWKKESINFNICKCFFFYFFKDGNTSTMETGKLNAITLA